MRKDIPDCSCDLFGILKKDEIEGTERIVECLGYFTEFEVSLNRGVLVAH